MRHLWIYSRLKLDSRYTALYLIHSARTSLACRRDCSSPSTKAIPTISIANNRIKIPTIYPIVKWNECESRYVTCPDGYSIVTYYSFTDTVYIHHNRTNATVYCGKHDNSYYVLYKNTRLNKNCSNTFEIVNCIRMFSADLRMWDALMQFILPLPLLSFNHSRDGAST